MKVKGKELYSESSAHKNNNIHELKDDRVVGQEWIVPITIGFGE